jgi:putative oxidoreductase
MRHGDPVLLGDPRGDQRAVAGLRVALDAEERTGALRRQRVDDRLDAGGIEDLARVALDIGRGQAHPRALTDALARIFGVLELSQLGGGGELLDVHVADSGVREGGLEARGVRPRILASTHPATLAYVDQYAHVRIPKGGYERVCVKAVNTDRRECLGWGHAGSYRYMLGNRLMRILIGGLFIGHGTQKLFGWFGGHGPDGTGRFFESIGLRPGKPNAIAAGAAEAGGGALLASGVGTPVAGAALHGVMTSAIKHVHAEKGPWSTEGGWEYNAVLMAAIYAIVERCSGRRWALASLAAGVGGALVVTELASRPELREGVVEVAEQPEPAETRVSESV